MKRSRKSKRVSWASGFNLCQVKLFLSEESPSQVGMDYQYHLHAKPSSMLHSNVTESHDLPPGFENNQYMNMEKEQCHIPQIKWKCPRKFVMNPNWYVVSGEESEELLVQTLREMRVLEAVYPRVSAIPPCPAVAFVIEEGYDDHLTPVIPIIPIEEEVLETPPSLRSTPNKTLINPPPASGTLETTKAILPALESPAEEKSVLGSSQGPQPDLITMKNDEIDTELLLKIFSDPKMVESLTKDYGAGAKARIMTSTNTVSESKAKDATRPINMVGPKPDIMVQQLNGTVCRLTNDRMEPKYSVAAPQLAIDSAPFVSKTVNNLLGPNPNMGPLPQNMVPSTMMPLPGSNRMIPMGHAKDADYYKNLIKRHGGDNQERLFQLDNNQKTQNVNTNQKPCAYFNGPKGCRKGANCNFKHEMKWQKRAAPMMEAQNMKRTRLGGELFGRT